NVLGIDRRNEPCRRRASVHDACPVQSPDASPQPHIGPVALNQILLSILARTSAFLTGQTNQVAGVFGQLSEPFMLQYSVRPDKRLGRFARVAFARVSLQQCCRISSVTSRDHPSAVRAKSCRTN